MENDHEQVQPVRRPRQHRNDPTRSDATLPVGNGYILVSGLRRLGLQTTELTQAQVSTIRTKLPIIGAQIRVTARKVWVSMASSYPYQDLYQQVWTNLRC